jgi:quercetin dioxygenase-like cupin family protein
MLIKVAPIIAAAAIVSGSNQADRPRPTGTTRTDLQRHDLSTRGKEVLQARVDFAPGAAFPGHSHPGEEIIYVLKGKLEYQLAGNPAVVLNGGDVLFVPAGVVHSARNVGDEPGSELATYVLEKGKPLVALAK